MPTDAELRGYLLGTTPEDVSTSIERTYFATSEALGTVAEAERDLIDDYLDGRLAPEQRARFESHYLASPPHRHRVAIARAIRERAAALPRDSREAAPTGGILGTGGILRAAWSPWALAAVLALGVVGIVWRLNAPTTGPMPVVAITLPAVIVRGEGGPPTLTVPASTEMVEIHLERATDLPCAAPEMAVQTVEGVETWRGPATEAGGDPTASGSSGVGPLESVARVPATALPEGDFIVSLFCSAGASPLERSSLRVVRR